LIADVRSVRFVCAGLLLSASTALAQESALRTVHVFVALADNQSQGIIPVPAKLGNGEDPEHNLYWGSAYGVRTFFARSADWERIACGQKPKAEILERCVFKHRATNVYLVADAYRGREIRQAILDFLSSAAGDDREMVNVPAAAGALTLPTGGGAIRGIGEKFQTNAAAGTGKLDVPLGLSPGRSGFGPDLSLSHETSTRSARIPASFEKLLGAIVIPNALNECAAPSAAGESRRLSGTCSGGLQTGSFCFFPSLSPLP